MIRMRFAVVLGGAVLIASCNQKPEDVANGDDPIKALSAPVESQKYNNVYWGRVSTSDPALWQKALGFCAQAKGGEYPTCQVVQTIDAYNKMAAPPPKSPDQPLTVDTGPASSRRPKP